VLLVLALFSAPIQQFDFFAEKTTATFPFTMRRAVYADGKIVSDTTFGEGMVTFSGNGSLSAGNALRVNVTVFLDRNALIEEPTIVVIKLSGAFFVPPQFDSHGIAGYAALALARKGDYWIGECQVKYNQGGSLPIIVEINEKSVVVVGYIEMGSQDVTIATKTNSLIISLTWAILAFAVLELRVCGVENDRHDRKKCE
jgi:hypothetical protein